MTRTLPDAFQACEVLPVNHYPGGTGADSAQPFSARRGRCANRPAHAGHLQQRLFRAQLPRAADGHRARRRPRPDRRRRHRLHEDDSRAEARGRDLPPRRRRFSRFARLPFRFHAGRARADGRLPRRQCGAGECRGQRRGGRQSDLRLRSRVYSLLPRRRSDPAKRGNLYLREARTILRTCSIIFRNWS